MVRHRILSGTGSIEDGVAMAPTGLGRCGRGAKALAGLFRLCYSLRLLTNAGMWCPAAC